VAIKRRAHELIEALPDAATWQDLLYALELRSDVEAGVADPKALCVTDTEDRRLGIRPTPMNVTWTARARTGLADLHDYVAQDSKWQPLIYAFWIPANSLGPRVRQPVAAPYNFHLEC
jgi:hypothetical protein